MTKLTHLDESGRARMVDVGGKPVTERSAVAGGQVRMARATFDLVASGSVPKGDVIAVAELAGVMAAKRTGELIPLCHPLGLDVITVEAQPDNLLPGIQIVATARLAGRTGVEMEVLTAVSVACLTVYDMVKAVDTMAVIENIRLLQKRGGNRGDWHREEASREATDGIPRTIEAENRAGGAAGSAGAGDRAEYRSGGGMDEGRSRGR